MKRLYTAQRTAAPTAFAQSSIGAMATTSGIECIQEIAERPGDNRMRVDPAWTLRCIGSVFVVAGVLLTSFVAEVHGREAMFSIKDTGHGFAGLPSTIQQIFWLDEDRILYTGYESSVRETRKEDGKSVTKRGIYVLDLRSNKLTRHADAEGFLCYRNGFVRYSVTFDRNSRIAVRREGRFGEEKEIVVDMREQPAGHRLNQLTCRDYDASSYATGEARLLPLLDGHGVFEFGQKGMPGRLEISAAKLQLANGTGHITLPISGNATYVSLIQYFEFANSYIAGYLAPEGPSKKWPKASVHRIYLLKPTGTVTEILLPVVPGSDRRLSTFALTRAGLFFYGGETRRYLSPGTAGLYLSDGKRVAKVVGGLLHGIGVSPRGCKLAVAMQTYAKTPDPTTIRVVDVCTRESLK